MRGSCFHLRVSCFGDSINNNGVCVCVCVRVCACVCVFCLSVSRDFCKEDELVWLHRTGVQEAWGCFSVGV